MTTHSPSVLRIREGWDGGVSDLIRYLVKEQIPSNEVDELKTFQLFTKRELVKNAKKRPRYRADELYPPEDIFCQLQLPVVNWDERLPWFNDSAEGRNIDSPHWNTTDKFTL